MKIYTLTLSPAFDIHAECENFKVLRENLLTLTAEDAGGKGINISRALASLGCETTPFILLGEEDSDKFLSKIGALQKNAQIIKTEGKIRENLTLHTKDGETRLSFKGAKAPADLFARISDMLFLDTGDVLTFTGSLPSGVSRIDAVEFLKKKKREGAKIVIDSRSLTLSDIYEISPYLIKPNEEEIYAYTGSEICTKEEAIARAREMHNRGIENVMISLGALGAALSSPEGDYFIEAPRITPVSTIGAGDSSIAGFLYAKSLGLSSRERLIHAVAFGSAAAMTEGTMPPRKEDIERLLKEISEK